MLIGDIDVFGRRGQEVVMVLYALQELRAIRTKAEVLDFIRRRRLYALRPEDKESYESKREWKSDTLLCFARKDAVKNGLMFDHDEKDSWEITRAGLQTLDQVIAYIRSRPNSVRRCFMWRLEFKQIVDPAHNDPSQDHIRSINEPRMSLVEKALALLRSMTDSERRPPP